MFSQLWIGCEAQEGGLRALVCAKERGEDPVSGDSPCQKSSRTNHFGVFQQEQVRHHPRTVSSLQSVCVTPRLSQYLLVSLPHFLVNEPSLDIAESGGAFPLSRDDGTFPLILLQTFLCTVRVARTLPLFPFLTAGRT